MSGLAGGSRRPAAAIARAAALCCALALAACGEQGGQPPAGEPGEPGASTTGGTQGSAGGTSETSGGLAVVAGPSGPLDTTNWVMQPPFYAAGDEPAWRLEIADGWFSFKRSALRAIEEPMVQPVKDGAADVFQTGSLKIVIRREACQAGGQTSELTVDVTYDDDTFGGCAFPALAAGVATTPEAAAVSGAVGSIDACLAKLAQPALVTGVAPRQDGAQTSVGLRSRNGTLYECGAVTATGEILYLDPIEVGAQAPWMNRMRFVREGVAVSAPCPDAEEVRGGEQVLGRMLTRTCKF
jgi:uncharacterized membrane protein